MSSGLIDRLCLASFKTPVQTIRFRSQVFEHILHYRISSKPRRSSLVSTAIGNLNPVTPILASLRRPEEALNPRKRLGNEGPADWPSRICVHRLSAARQPATSLRPASRQNGLPSSVGRYRLPLVSGRCGFPHFIAEQAPAWISALSAFVIITAHRNVRRSRPRSSADRVQRTASWPAGGLRSRMCSPPPD